MRSLLPHTSGLGMTTTDTRLNGSDLAAVTDILADLHEVVFPGYGRRQNLSQANIGFYIGGLIDALHPKLTEQIARALRHDRCKDDADFHRCEGEAAGKALDLLRRLPHI